MLIEHQIWRWCHDHTSSPPYFSWLTINLHPKNDNSLLLNTLTSAGADPGFFLGGGALVSCSTSTPINHMVFFYRIPVVLENRRSSRGGEGGGCAPPHPPPRSAPVLHACCTNLSLNLSFLGWEGGKWDWGGGAVVVAWHKAELINFSNQFDFLTSFTNLLHLSLNISNIVILFWGSGIGRWVWPDIRAEVIAFSNQFYFLTSWTNIVWKWIWNKEKQTTE